MGASLCKSILPLVFAFSSLANAAEHFSFAGVDLSLTPQQVIDKSVANGVTYYGGIRVTTNVKPEKKSNAINYNESITNLIWMQIQAINKLCLIEKTRSQLQKLCSFPKEDIEIESNIEHFEREILGMVGYGNEKPLASISILYMTIPGFKQSPLSLSINGESVQYVPDVFNQRYGQNKKLAVGDGTNAAEWNY